MQVWTCDRRQSGQLLHLFDYFLRIDSVVFVIENDKDVRLNISIFAKLSSSCKFH